MLVPVRRAPPAAQPRYAARWSPVRVPLEQSSANVPSNTTELVLDVDSRFPRLAASNAEGAFDVEHEPEQYLEQEARNGFEFGLERLLDGIEAYLSRP